MPRKKKEPPSQVQARRDGENESQQRYISPPEPVLASEPDPDSSEHIPYNEYKRGLLSETISGVGMESQSLIDVDADNNTPLSSAAIDEYQQKVRRILGTAGYKRPLKAKETRDAKIKTATLNKLGPVVKQYNLFVNPSTKRTMLLQYPNREAGQEYRAANGQKPLEIRIKPKCGLVEVDIPMNIHANFDKVKGIEYGEALRSSRLLQRGGSYGLAGGLAVGTKPTVKDARRATAPEGPSQEKLLENFEDADNKGHVMNKITLGGMVVPFRDGNPIYMTATFKGGKCRRLSRRSL